MDESSYWSSEIKATVQSPYAILEPQAQALSRQTNGILVGELSVSHEAEGKRARIQLDLVVPALDSYRHRILVVTHDVNMVYPARLHAECFERSTDLGALLRPKPLFMLDRPEKQDNDAAGEEEFRRLLKRVLTSPEVTSVAVSLIARANEVLKAKEQAAHVQAEAGGPARTDLPPANQSEPSTAGPPEDPPKPEG
jgi:hypothetical protein